MNWKPETEGWRQKKNRHSEPVADQIADLAAALLAEGFSVMVSDDEARKKAEADANEPGE